MVPVGLVWLLTRPIRNFGVRLVPRVFIFASIFGWVIVPAPELHGALPMPVPWAIWVGIQESRWGMFPNIGLFVAISTAFLWCTIIAVRFIVLKIKQAAQVRR
jgi:hypothetical protein